MYISELELQGFKSFAYKTNISFDKGITAIVGPNGCGKSNIVDGMRWVLGEQRPTLLRSANMANVIFNGTAKKNALGMADVSLTFVNNKGLLPTEYNEVTIGRRLYRSGESEYLINGTTCRLKDITELFRDTGMSSDAYSVIELKMVEEILDDKNNDRRRLFEEAAGVTGYKEKRKKTFRKLDETRSDLQRVEDILVEVRKKANSLERQAEKAQQAKEYKSELEHLDKALNKHEYLQIKQELEPLEERIGNADKEKKEILAKAERLEEEAEEARTALNEKERRQSEAQRRVSQLHSKIRDTETTLEITREKISNEKSVIEQYTKDIEQSEKDLEDLREAFQSSQKKLESFGDDLQKAEHNLNESKGLYSEIQQRYSAERDELDQLESAFSQANQDLNDLQTKHIKIESRLENTEGDLARIREEIEDLKDEIMNFRGEKKLVREKLEKAKKGRDDQQKKLQQAREQRKELSEKQDELKDQVRSHKSKLDSVTSEIELLRDIADSDEAFPGSVQFLLENYDQEFPLLDVVSNVLSTDEKHAVALEAVLADTLNYVVVDTLDDAHRAAKLLKENDKGRATFIPLDQLSNSYETVTESLVKQVESNPKFNPLKELLLGNVRIFDSVDEAYSTISGRQTGVTLDGEVITDHQFLQSGSKNKNAGIRVGLKDKISKLEDKAGSITADIQNAEKELDDVRQQYQAIDLPDIEQELKEKEQQVREYENQINSFEQKIEIYQNNIGEREDRRESLINSEDSSKEEMDKLQPKQKKLQKKLKDLHEQQEEKKQALQELEEERSIAQSRYNEAQLKHQDLKNKVENHERDIKRAEDGIKNLKQRLKNRSEKTEEAKERIKQHKSSIEQLEEELSSLKEQKQDADKALEEAEELSGKQRGRINQIEKDLKEVRRRKEVNMELVHHLAMSKEKYEMQIENLSDHIWETYGVLMDQIDKELPEGTEPDEAKERIAWLKQKLNKIGEINPLAIEEYEEEKERLDFYEEQVGDLHQATEELRETIDEINKTATARFNETFEKIRVNFQKVFHTLFNEDDYCDLVIDEEAEEDLLEAKIEIKANPKGKRPSTINQLSGGEKTLTAIALLFAIYLVKPSPFCVLDEVDAPLDDANIERFSNMIKRFSEDTQFIIITHNKKTMSNSEMMYGVTMPETGISRLVGVKLDEVAEV